MNRQEDHSLLHPAGSAWYLLQCKPGQTIRAKENLINQGYTCYLPALEIERLRQGRRRFISEPLFPGYLFIYMHAQQDNWSPLRSTRGVARVVAFGGQPQPVPEEVVQALQERVAHTPRIHTLHAGDKVRITEGAFTDIEAIFQSYEGDERVVLLLKLMNREQQLHIPAKHITSLQPGHVM